MKEKNNHFIQNKLVVVMIDMQDFFLKNLKTEIRKALVANQLKILELCVKNKIPVIIFEYKAGGVKRGRTTRILQRKIECVPETLIKIKENNSGFRGTNISSVLEGMKCKKILLMGINANGCVQDTAIGALRRGYRVMVSKGLMASTSRKDIGMSRKNEKWYLQNCLLLESPEEALKELSK